jgi:hypothetical protein
MEGRKVDSENGYPEGCKVLTLPHNFEECNCRLDRIHEWIIEGKVYIVQSPLCVEFSYDCRGVALQAQFLQSVTGRDLVRLGARHASAWFKTQWHERYPDGPSLCDLELKVQPAFRSSYVAYYVVRDLLRFAGKPEKIKCHNCGVISRRNKHPQMKQYYVPCREMFTAKRSKPIADQLSESAWFCCVECFIEEEERVRNQWEKEKAEADRLRLIHVAMTKLKSYLRKQSPERLQSLKQACERAGISLNSCLP